MTYNMISLSACIEIEMVIKMNDNYVNNNVIISGVDPDYDKALANIQSTRTWFDQYLKKQCATLGCRVSV